MTAQALVSAIDGMTNESSGDELFSELETQEYKEAFELFDKVSESKSHYSTMFVQGSAKRRSPGLVNFVTALAFHSCLALPAACTQPGDHL